MGINFGGERSRKSRLKEIVVVSLTLFAVFLAISFLSYHPTDPSLNSVGTEKGALNWGGVVGSYFADAGYQLLGLTCFLLPLICLAMVAYIIFKPNLASRIGKVAGFVILIIAVAALLELVVGYLNIEGQKIAAGGLLGTVVGSLLVKYLNIAGAYLFILASVLISLILTTSFSVIKLWEMIAGLINLRFSQEEEEEPIIPNVLQPESRAEKRGFKFPNFSFFKRGSRREDLDVDEPKSTEVEEEETQYSTESEDDSQVEEEVTEVGEYDEQADPEVVDDIEVVEEEPPAGATVEDRPPAKRFDLRNIFSPFAKKEKKKTKNDSDLEERDIQRFEIPPLSFLSDTPQITSPYDKKALLDNAHLLEQKLADFGIEGRVSQVKPGPVITLYEVEPGPGVKVNRIVNLADDLQLALSALSVRIIAPIPGKAAVGIEISNSTREMVYLREIISHTEFQGTQYCLPLAFGKDISGDLFMADLQKMPHLLVAGATGAGKSVFINALICSLLYRFSPDELGLLMIDPKILELTQYEGIPHLVMPVVTDTPRASLALKWTVREMERRYDLMSKVGARNIHAFNHKVREGIVEKHLERLSKEELQLLRYEEVKPLPFLVVVIDELSELMMVSAKDVELSIARLAQMARAGGIHLIVSTQRPSVDVLTGLIKANFPARVSFQVSSKVDSRTILDTQGAERLLGSGDMLFLPPGTAKLVRIHAPYVSDEEVAKITSFLRKQGAPMHEGTVLDEQEERDAIEADFVDDELYDQAVALVAQSRQASISMIQRRLRIGYNRAANIIERMEAEGVVGPSDGVRPRDVLVNPLDQS